MSRAAFRPCPPLPHFGTFAGLRGAAFAGAALAALSSTACGRPATERECSRIVERITQLELERAHVTDEASVQTQLTNTQATFRERALSQCVGKRITQSAVTCVENAESADQIVDECFR